MQTLNMTDNTHTTLHKHKQAKEDNNWKEKKRLHNRRRTLRITTHKHIHIQTIEPQVPAASPTHAAKPEKQQYMVSIQRQKKDYFTSKSVSMIVRLAIQPRKDGANVQKYGRKKIQYYIPNICFSIMDVYHKKNIESKISSGSKHIVLLFDKCIKSIHCL